MTKKMKIMMITLALLIGLALSFGSGCVLGISKPPASTGQGLGVVEEAWNLISRNYVEKDRLDSGNLTEGAIKGLVEALDDPYTAYLSPQLYQLSTSDMAGQFEGIGAGVGNRDGQIIIITPFPDMPAARAGIKAGDIILKIDDNTTSGMSLQEAVLRIRGPKGTAARLLVLHQGETEPVEIAITRDEIKVPSVVLEMKGDIAHISILSFTGRTNEELTTALENMKQKGATGIIIDVRSNLGGLLDTVVDVASHFLKEGVVVTIVDNQGKRTSLSVKPTSITTDLPMVVLTDNYSASGSEILAGAFQDYKRATIAGTKTYGKGSANVLYQLSNGGGLYITTSRWLTPNGRLIEGKGILPDYELELKGEDAINWAIDFLKGKK